MYVEYFIELEEISCIGTSSRWAHRYAEYRPDSYAIGCGFCGRTYCRVTLLSPERSDWTFVNGWCWDCYERNQRTRRTLCRVVPGSFLRIAHYEERPALFDAASTELLKVEFLRRSTFLLNGGYL